MKYVFSSLFFAFGFSAVADVPHQFSAGTPAKASEVNENFSALDASINENGEGITANSEDITANSQEITANKNKVSAIENSVGALGEANATNMVAIEGNSVNLEQQANDIEEAIARIELNKTAIEINSTLITTATDTAMLANQGVVANSNAIGGLNDQITAVETNLAEIEASDDDCSGSDNWYTGAHKNEINYEAKTADVGQLITISGNNYRMIKVPFAEFKTGDLYALTYPEPERELGQVYSSIYATHVIDDTTCRYQDISGYPATKGSINESRRYSVNNVGNYDSTVTLSTSYNFSIKVGETYISMTMSATDDVSGVRVYPEDYDFTDDFASIDRTHTDEQIRELDDLIDYIQITKE